MRDIYVFACLKFLKIFVKFLGRSCQPQKIFARKKIYLSRETWGIGVFDDGKDSRIKKLGIMRDNVQCLAGSKKDPQKAQSRGLPKIGHKISR